jgi:transposase
MEKQDLRKLDVSAQEAIRVKVLKALDSGMRKVDIIKTFGVSDAAIYKWIKVRGTRKKNWFKQEKRGRTSQISLTKKQEKQVKKMISDKCPDQLKLPFALWTRDAVGDLLRDKFGVDVSVLADTCVLGDLHLRNPFTKLMNRKVRKLENGWKSLIQPLKREQPKKVVKFIGVMRWV